MSNNGYLRRADHYESARSRRVNSTGRDWKTGELAWSDPIEAPFGQPLQCCVVQEGSRDEYTLPFPCIRTLEGWTNAKTGVRLQVTVTGWRRRDWATAELAPYAHGKTRSTSAGAI